MNVIISITGKLKNIKRKEAADLINIKTNAFLKERGFSKEVNYLVCANKKTFKYKKAKKNGTKIISEKQMMSYIKKGKFPNSKKLKF